MSATRNWCRMECKGNVSATAIKQISGLLPMRKKLGTEKGGNSLSTLLCAIYTFRILHTLAQWLVFTITGWVALCAVCLKFIEIEWIHCFKSLFISELNKCGKINHVKLKKVSYISTPLAVANSMLTGLRKNFMLSNLLAKFLSA